jgi:chaperonin GroEL
MITKTSVAFNPEEKLLKGVETLANAVTTTLGPRGRNVAIAKFTGDGRVYERIVVHDGVTVAKSIDLEDELENMGAQLVKQASQKQVQDVGDGTTVAVLLAYQLLREINKRVAAGINPMALREEVESQVKSLIAEIQKLSTPVKDFEQKLYIATVSAEDPELGKMVAEVIEEMGINGLVMVEESKNNQTTVEHQEGMQLDKGWLNQYFVTNPDRMEAVLENPKVLVTDREINSLMVIKNIVEGCANSGDKLLIISPSVGVEALRALVANKMNGVLSCLAVQAPSFGNNQRGFLQDIAIFTGGKFISTEAGLSLEKATVEDLGSCESVSATKEATVLVGGNGQPQEVTNRIASLESQIESESSDFDREKLKERLAKLTSGVSVIRVGGATEVEMKERLERVKDAVAAVKAAVNGGIVAGGETIYLKARRVLKPTDILYAVVYEPFKLLVSNAGLDDGQLYEKLQSAGGKNLGVDVRTGELVDMISEGIIDPTLVSVNALLNASSVAIQIATTGAVVTPQTNELSMSKLPQ